MKPMSEFDPSAPAMVHDRLNDRTFEWKPEWRAAYEKHAARHAPGVIEFDGLLLRRARRQRAGGRCRGFSFVKHGWPP